MRSLGAQSARDYEALANGAGKQLRIIFYAVDFDDELTALSGSALASQIRFVNYCIQVFSLRAHR